MLTMALGFPSHSSPSRAGTVTPGQSLAGLLFLLYSWGNQGSERLRSLPKATQQHTEQRRTQSPRVPQVWGKQHCRGRARGRGFWFTPKWY